MASRKIAAFERIIDLSVASVTPPELQKLHARVARQVLAEHLATLPTRPPVKTIVDGRIGASEDSVKAYGRIRYEFGFLQEIAPLALDHARKVSPVDSGRYRDAWVVLADGVVVDAGAVPDETVELTIVNPMPYSRKLNVGKNLDGTPFVVTAEPYFVEDINGFVFRRWGNIVTARVRYIDLHGAYTIKVGNAVLLARQAARGRGVNNATRAMLQPRKDRNAGTDVTYPAVVIRQR